MSQFKWRDLIKLNSKNEAYSSPLACLAHTDVNAFFAQAEQIRCGYTKDDPVVCVQWGSIIAVSYAARKYNIKRMDNVMEALRKSDNQIIPIHTAVYKKGEDFWQYHDGYGKWNKDKDKQLSAEEYKVSLNPYRREGRKIFKIMKEWCDLVEVASSDEGFLDLSRLCLQKLLFDKTLKNTDEDESANNSLQSLFVNGQYNLDDPLPPVPKYLKNLQYEGFVYGDDDDPLINDWDDIMFCLGSIIMKELRDDIEKTLGYTTSCGISRTKSVCKLASNYKKPNAQTIIRNKTVTKFLDKEEYEITSFWTLGGKLGKDIVKVLELPSDGSLKYIRDSWPTNSKELKAYIDMRVKSLIEKGESTDIDVSKTDVLASKLFDLSRGEWLMPLNTRPLVKSMMSNKNLRGQSCNSIVDCIQWFDIFSNELVGRLEELGEEYNKIFIPKTVAVSLLTNESKSHSKSGPVSFRGSSLYASELSSRTADLLNSIYSMYSEKGKTGFFPLKQLTATISNIEIIDNKTTVLDMFGQQVQKTVKIEKGPTPAQAISVEPKLQDNKNIVDDQYECASCKISFKSIKEFSEHKDFHIAQKLSEGLNGMDENSRFLSIGERRLLSSSKNKANKDKSINKKVIKPNKTKQAGTGSILNFFKK